eukprot:COSAG06_NODE_66_length_26393_cov_6.455161_4_plen_133_part_00
MEQSMTPADAQRNLSEVVADSVTEQYAAMLDGLIEQLGALEDKVATLERNLAAMTRARNDAVAERDLAVEERDGGVVGDEDRRDYCEVCDRPWNRTYVTWFRHPFTTEDGRRVNSACHGCYDQVPNGHEPLA